MDHKLIIPVLIIVLLSVFTFILIHEHISSPKKETPVVINIHRISSKEADHIKSLVHQVAERESKHVNTIHAELKDMFGYTKYREIDVETYQKVVDELQKRLR